MILLQIVRQETIDMIELDYSAKNAAKLFPNFYRWFFA